ncbi:hypothetical protein OIO90_004575 [Microbotryomycetes sp. JL221]|nr:hypothetical protein OIO90_004575 [Microbotryomycetes sp. JL221]
MATADANWLQLQSYVRLARQPIVWDQTVLLFRSFLNLFVGHGTHGAGEYLIVPQIASGNNNHHSARQAVKELRSQLAAISGLPDQKTRLAFLIASRFCKRGSLFNVLVAMLGRYARHFLVQEKQHEEHFMPIGIYEALCAPSVPIVVPPLSSRNLKVELECVRYCCRVLAYTIYLKNWHFDEFSRQGGTWLDSFVRTPALIDIGQMNVDLVFQRDVTGSVPKSPTPWELEDAVWLTDRLYELLMGSSDVVAFFHVPDWQLSVVRSSFQYYLEGQGAEKGFRRDIMETLDTPVQYRGASWVSINFSAWVRSFNWVPRKPRTGILRSPRSPLEMVFSTDSNSDQMGSYGYLEYTMGRFLCQMQVFLWSNQDIFVHENQDHHLVLQTLSRLIMQDDFSCMRDDHFVAFEFLTVLQRARLVVFLIGFVTENKLVDRFERFVGLYNLYRWQAWAAHLPSVMRSGAVQRDHNV